MAYTRRKSASRARARGRSASGRTSYRSRSVRRSPRRRATGRTGGRGQTIRIEIVGGGADSVSRPVIGMKPASAPRKAMF